jgi:hypothetical protein
VRELDSELLVLAVQEVGDSFYGRDLGVGPETGVFWCYAAIREDRGGFNYCEGGAAVSKC